MKIGIDGTPLTIPFSCGTKRYAVNLIENLSKIDSKNEYIIFATKKVKIPENKNFSFRKTPSILPFFKRQFFLSHFVNKEKVDVFHYLSPYGDLFLNHKSIVTTVHDMNLNMTYPVLSRYFPNRLICEITRAIVLFRTKKFITPTQTIKNELVNYLKSKKSKNIVKVIPHGSELIFRANKKYKFKQKFILCMGDFSHRKNVSNTLVAYSLLPSIVRAEYQLKIIVSTQDVVKDFAPLLKKLDIMSTSKILVNITNEELYNLYSHATCFLYPSLYEGFGLPVIEAMSLGTPVITSNFGAMKEVAKGSALLVDPFSPQDISEAILKIIKNKNLKASLIKKGVKTAKRYSWKKSATETLRIYEEAA